MTPLSIIEHFEMFKDQRCPAWLPPVTDTGDDGLIPVSTFRRSSRHKRCPSSCLGETCSPSCLLLAGAAGKPSPHTDRHDRNGGAGQASADGGGAPSASRQSVEPAVCGRGSPIECGLDITYIWTLEGWLYLDVLLDRYSRCWRTWLGRLATKSTRHKVLFTG